SGTQRFAAIEISAPIPLAIPTRLFRSFPQLRGLFLTKARKGLIAARSGQGRKLFQDIVKEEREPDAFAFTLVPDPIHPVVPITGTDEGQAVLAEAQGLLERAGAMFVQGRCFARTLWLVEITVFFRPDRAAFQERNLFVQHSGVAERFHVTAGRVRQPEKVVGTMRAHPAIGGGGAPKLPPAPAGKMGGGGGREVAPKGGAGEGGGHGGLQIVAR